MLQPRSRTPSPVVVNSLNIHDVHLPSESEPDGEDNNSAVDWEMIDYPVGPEPEPPRATSPISDPAVAEPRATAAPSDPVADPPPGTQPEPTHAPVTPPAFSDVRVQPSAAKPKRQPSVQKLSKEQEQRMRNMSNGIFNMWQQGKQTEKEAKELIMQEEIRQEIKDNLGCLPPNPCVAKRQHSEAVSMNGQVDDE
jgi:hypothetical protein